VFRAARKTLELVANNGLNAGIVLPEEKWQSSRTHLVRAATLSVRRNGDQLGSGELWPLAGGPGASVDWLRQHLAGLGFGLLPGQIVLAGTPLGLYRVEARDQIAIFIDDEQAAHCSID
jgi:2-keto-4-pentenoate hydratase